MDTVETILSDCQAMLSGHFLLSSGKHSSRYFQCARLLQYPEQASIVVAGIVEQILSAQIASGLLFDSIIGPAMGGIVVAYELGRQLGRPAFFTERDDQGIMSLRRGFEIKQGEKIIIAEDVVTTGKSTIETAECIKKLGGIVVASTCIVDRRPENGPDVFDWPLFSAARLPAVLWDEANCPLCKGGREPAIKPGSRKIF